MLIGCCVNMLPKESSDAGAWYAPEIKAAGYDYLELPIGQVAGPWYSAVPGPNPARKDFTGTGRSINWPSGAVRSGTRPASGVL